MSRNAVVLAAEEGLEYTMTLGRGTKVECVVGPKCDDVNAPGSWRCVTHDEGFDNQLQKDFHIHSGKHVLVWICSAHGPEVP